MIPYKDKSGTSGVQAYQVGPDWIRVKFKTEKKIYKYSYASAGIQHVETMKLLAEKGEKLSTYISRHVKDKYE